MPNSRIPAPSENNSESAEHASNGADQGAMPENRSPAAADTSPASAGSASTSPGPGAVSGSAAYPPAVSREELQGIMTRARQDRPRLLMTPDDIERIRNRVRSEPEYRQVAQAVRRDADAMLSEPPLERIQEGRRLLNQSRRAVRRLLTLAMAHHLTGKAAYADRAVAEMQAIAGFSDWNPSHFLDVAEMTFAMAIGYDWLYHHLDSSMRATVRQAILQKGVRVPLDTEHNRWTRAHNNWGQVCHGGMVAGALALWEDDPETAVDTVQRALDNVTASMAVFAPKGNYPEGPGYWSYGTTYNVLLIDMLESLLGTSFGLDLAPGFDQTGAYLTLATGPSGLSFNYADGGAGRSCEPALYWFASRYRRPDWVLVDAGPRERAVSAPAEGSSARNRFLPLMLLWMAPSEGGATVDLPLHWTSGCKVPIALHRSSWDDPNAVFVGLKAGSPSGPHGHMDIGAFVLDADGVRWAMDLGAEGYHRIESRGMGFWNMAQDSDRWKVFRQNNFSHNTLVIDDDLQRVAGHADIVRFSTAPDFPCSVVDLTPVYADRVGSAHRGIAVLPGGDVLVRDRLTGLKPGARVRWGMVTPGKPVEAGARSMTLEQGGASLVLRILLPAESVWVLYDTATPKNEWDSPNPGTVMTGFEVVAPDCGTVDLAVVLTPGSRVPTPEDEIPRDPPHAWEKPVV